MSIEMADEVLISFHDATRAFPGRAIRKGTLYRWWRKGVRGVRLETILVGGQRYTSREAIERFLLAQNAPAQNAGRSAAQRTRQSLAARNQLEQLGL